MSVLASVCECVFVNVERKRRGGGGGGGGGGRESISTVLPVSPLFTRTPTLHGTILPSLLLNGHFCGNVLPVKTAAAAAPLHKLLHAGFKKKVRRGVEQGEISEHE